jgi:Na+/H+-translocating membrane pyrophosphatase
MATFAVLLVTIILVALLLCMFASYNTATLFSVGATILVEIFFAGYVLWDMSTRRNLKK